MEAWGSDRDLFTRGEAELVTDEALTAEPLASPGVVIKRLRGTAEEQLAALPPNKPRTATPRRRNRNRSGAPSQAAYQAARARAPAARRSTLAEQALAELEERHARERRALAEREAELARERRALEKTQGCGHRPRDARAG